MNPSVVFGAMARFMHGVAQEGALELRGFGLSPAQFQLLERVARRPGIAQWELVEAFGVTKGNVSQLVKKLEVAGLLSRSRRQGSDELSLTVEGQALVARVIPAHEAFMARQFAALSADELATLHRLIARLA